MKQFLIAFTILVSFTACQKGTTENNSNPNPNTPLQEQTLTGVSYGTDTAQRMDIYLPANRTAAATKAIIIVHGGAWVAGDKTEMNGFIPVIKQQLPEYAIFNINYRLAALPATNTFPTQETDMKAAVNFILGKSSEYVFNTDKIVLLGASAGGHLVLLQGYKNASPKVKAVVDLFGPADMVGMYNAYPAGSFNQLGIQLLMNGTPATNASLYQSSSPVNFITAQTPPTLILHGTADPIVPYNQSTDLKAKLDAKNVGAKLVTYTGAGHGDWSAAIYADAYQQIVSFLKTYNP